MTFQQLDAKLRTNEDFHNMTAEDHHTGISPFTELLTIGCVTNFPLDYTHLVCLGVVPRTVMLWMSGPLSCRMSGTQVRQVSGELLRFRNHLPKAFSRKPRSLDEIRKWKAVYAVHSTCGTIEHSFTATL